MSVRPNLTGHFTGVKYSFLDNCLTCFDTILKHAWYHYSTYFGFVCSAIISELPVYRLAAWVRLLRLLAERFAVG
jgi:hypothetical protein